MACADIKTLVTGESRMPGDATVEEREIAKCLVEMIGVLGDYVKIWNGYPRGPGAALTETRLTFQLAGSKNSRRPHRAYARVVFRMDWRVVASDRCSRRRVHRGNETQVREGPKCLQKRLFLADQAGSNTT